MSEERPAYIDDALEMIGAKEPRQIVTEVSGFYPVFEALVEKYGNPITPAVFGVAWRYCQMADGVCRASLDTISKAIGLDKATVSRHLKTLCSDGYLRDLTPSLRNRPHVYADSGLVVMKSAMTAHVAQNNATVAESRTTVAQNNATVAENRLSKDINKVKNNKREKGDKTECPIMKAITDNKVGHNWATVRDVLNEWQSVHPDEWILKAIRMSQGNHINYADTILRKWEEGGYPPERKTPPGRTAQTSYTPPANVKW